MEVRGRGGAFDLRNGQALPFVLKFIGQAPARVHFDLHVYQTFPGGAISKRSGLGLNFSSWHWKSYTPQATEIGFTLYGQCFASAPALLFNGWLSLWVILCNSRRGGGRRRVVGRF
jgi:hypothetical protein